jgi:hypothetical protein
MRPIDGPEGLLAAADDRSPRLPWPSVILDLAARTGREVIDVNKNLLQ